MGRYQTTRRRKRKRERPIHRKIRNTMDYDKLLMEQDGRCAICKEPWQQYHPVTGKKRRRLHRDHDHKRLYGRGLLCYQCNVRLRGDVSAEWCEAAAEYLKKYEELHKEE